MTTCVRCSSAPLLESLCPAHLGTWIEELKTLSASGDAEALALLASIALRLVDKMST